MHKISCFKEVDDDWYPNIDGKYVRVTLYLNTTESENLVCVWGNDDCGMEYIGDVTAEFMFLKLLKQPILNKEICKEIGLKPA